MGYTGQHERHPRQQALRVLGHRSDQHPPARTGEVPCRTRFSFGISANGKKLYIYGAGFEIEVYDAVTFKQEATWDLGNDMTGGGLLALP